MKILDTVKTQAQVKKWASAPYDPRNNEVVVLGNDLRNPRILRIRRTPKGDAVYGYRYEGDRLREKGGKWVTLAKWFETEPAAMIREFNEHAARVTSGELLKEQTEASTKTISEIVVEHLNHAAQSEQSLTQYLRIFGAPDDKQPARKWYAALDIPVTSSAAAIGDAVGAEVNRVIEANGGKFRGYDGLKRLSLWLREAYKKAHIEVPKPMPVHFMNELPGTVRKQPKRDLDKRTMTTDQLKAFYAVLSQPQNDKEAVLFRVLRGCCLTMCRKREVADFSPEEVIGDHWVIPAERMKTRKEHRIALTPALRAALGDGFRVSEPATETKKARRDEPVNGDDLNRAMARALKRAGISELLTPHDIRRTVSTLAIDEACPFGQFTPDTVQHAQAHSVGGSNVQKRYQRAKAYQTGADRLFVSLADWLES